MPNFWLIFATLAGTADVAYNYLSRTSLRNGGDASSYAWWFSFLRLIFFSFLILFTGNPLKFSTYQFGLLATLGLINFFNLSLFMKMHTLTELSLSQIILRLRMVWVPLLAFFLIGEKLQPLEYLGIVLLFFAAAVVASPKKIIKDPALLTTFIFSLTTSIVTLLIQRASLFTQTPTIIFAMSAPTVLLTPLVIKGAKTRLFRKWNKELPQKFFIAALSVVLLYALVWAFRLGPVGKVNAIFQGVSILSVLAGITFLKEKENLVKKIIGSALAFGGILLLI